MRFQPSTACTWRSWAVERRRNTGFLLLQASKISRKIPRCTLYHREIKWGTVSWPLGSDNILLWQVTVCPSLWPPAPITRNPDSGLSGTRILQVAMVWWWSNILATDSLATSSKFSKYTLMIGFCTSSSDPDWIFDLTVQWSQCSLHLLSHDKIGICTCCNNPTRSDKKLTRKRSNLKSKHEHISNHFNTVNSMRAMLCVWQWTDCLRK